MRRVMALVVLIFLFSGCATKIGTGSPIEEPPKVAEINIGTEDAEYRSPVLASNHPEVINLSKMREEVSFTVTSLAPSRTSAWEEERSRRIPAPEVVVTNEGAMRNYLLTRQIQGLNSPFDYPTAGWIGNGRISLKERTTVSFNMLGASRHYYQEEPGKMMNQQNTGFGVRVALENDVFFKGTTVFFEANALKNTKNGLATTFCPGMDFSLLKIGGFTFSPALATCAGSYYNKESGKILPILGFMPGFSIKGPNDFSFNVVFLLQNPLLPAGKAAASLAYINQAPAQDVGLGMNPNHLGQGGINSPFGAPTATSVSLRLIFNAFFEKHTDLKNRWW